MNAYTRTIMLTLGFVLLIGGLVFGVQIIVKRQH